MSHDHPHPHPHPHPSGPPPMAISSNPAMTALLDSLPTSSLPFALTEVALPPGAAPPQQPGAPAPTQQLITCAIHKQVVCEPCGVNYAALNYMHQFMRGAPPEAIPPPPNVQAPPQRAEMIKNAKEAGNVSRRCAASERFDLMARLRSSKIISPLRFNITRDQPTWHCRVPLGSRQR